MLCILSLGSRAVTPMGVVTEHFTTLVYFVKSSQRNRVPSIPSTTRRIMSSVSNLRVL